MFDWLGWLVWLVISLWPQPAPSNTYYHGVVIADAPHYQVITIDIPVPVQAVRDAGMTAGEVHVEIDAELGAGEHDADCWVEGCGPQLGRHNENNVAREDQCPECVNPRIDGPWQDKGEQ